MNRKKVLLTYLVLLGILALILLAVISLETENHGSGTASVMQYLSDGFFTAAVLYIGCSVLMFIEEAGNFYGLQYLWHTVVRLFSPSKRHLEEKKDYFTYCQEKKERRAEEGKTPLKSAMLFVGLGCLALSIVFTLIFYQAG